MEELQKQLIQLFQANVGNRITAELANGMIGTISTLIAEQQSLEQKKQENK